MSNIYSIASFKSMCRRFALRVEFFSNPNPSSRFRWRLCATDDCSITIFTRYVTAKRAFELKLYFVNELDVCCTGF